MIDSKFKINLKNNNSISKKCKTFRKNCLKKYAPLKGYVNAIKST